MKNLNLLPKFKYGLVCAMMLLLAACSYYQHSMQKQEEIRQCLLHCEQRYQTCLSVCDDNLADCNMKSQARSAVHFAHYRHQQTMKGQVVTAETKAFQDPLACRKTTCDCVEDKNMCHQACRGFINKRLQYAMQLK